jgi:uncharacterized protein with HEPN domain
MNDSDTIRLRHMIEAAQEALSIAGGRLRDELLLDRTAGLAVRKALEIIGEAASKVSADLRARETGVPWADMVGMRDRLIHAYFDVAMDVVWETVERDLPILLAELNRIAEGASDV